MSTLAGALCVALAVLSLGAAVTPRARPQGRLVRWQHRRIAALTAEIRLARLDLDPRLLHWTSLALPPLATLAVWSLSPVLALGAGAAAVMAPRWIITWLVGRRRERGERDAPQLLRLLVANLGAGATYFDALRAARDGLAGRAIAGDLDVVVRGFLLDVPLERALREGRSRVAGRNLALVWDNLAICVARNLPAERARDLLLDLTTTVRHNLQLAGEVRAQTSGQRAQVWILALLVPGIYLYLRLASPYLLSVLDDTWTGRWLLLPAAALLEGLGIWLSFRLSRVAA